MSVIVAGVDMPTGCNFSCPCHDGESGFCEAAYTRYGDYKHISEDYDSVPKNCPLKSVDGLIAEICKRTVAPTPAKTAVIEQVTEIIREYCEEGAVG